ncbi:hypothetical protein DPMN_173438 [Dreissena polymorpha]|uniref:Uncharacterized protein n=1 Tax=Dreissena polymorpha TaxID=45954 RepID=A0A9D4E2V2_DREPO|nr:hypothetical protein DPMN_173438 [Dreissena polymorpha]
MFSFSLRLYSRLGKRPPTSFLRASRFLANLSSFQQILAICSPYASRAQRQVFLRRLLFLSFWGFKCLRDCLDVTEAGFRRVWPIHCQHL